MQQKEKELWKKLTSGNQGRKWSWLLLPGSLSTILPSSAKLQDKLQSLISFLYSTLSTAILQTDTLFIKISQIIRKSKLQQLQRESASLYINYSRKIITATEVDLSIRCFPHDTGLSLLSTSITHSLTHFFFIFFFFFSVS